MITRRSLLAAIALSGVSTEATAAMKTHLAFGDSITSGEANYGSPVTSAIYKRCGISSSSVGIGGTCLARGPGGALDAFAMYELCEAKVNNNWTAQIAAANTFAEPNKSYYTSVVNTLAAAQFNPATMDSSYILTLAFGRNDFQYSRPIGSDTDTTDLTFKGAINFILTQLMGHFPRLQIMLGTPIWSATGNTPNSAGHKLIDYADALIKIGALHSVPVLDLYRTSGINADNAATMLIDGTHPDADGYNLIANAWASAMVPLAGMPDSGASSLVTTVATPPPVSGWTIWLPGYWIEASLRDGLVTLIGLLRPGVGAAYTTLCYLPAIFAPPRDLSFATPSDAVGSTMIVQVMASGVVRLGGTFHGSYVSLDGITYRAG